MYAVIETGGKQYKVSVGDVIEVEKLSGNAGDKIELKAIMTVDKDKVVTGESVTATVTGKILGQGKDKKVVVYTYKAKKNIRRKLGHRQPFTRIKIEKIA